MTNIFQAMTTMIVVSLFCQVQAQQSSSVAVASELEEVMIYKQPILYELWSRDEMVQLGGYGEEKLSTVLITGSVVCQACHRSWPIPGAMVGVQCETSSKIKSSTTQATTDEYGDFMIDLPSRLHGIGNLEKMCSVEIIRIPKSSICQPALVKKRKRMTLSSVRNEIRTYTVGKIRLRHITSKPLKSCIPMATNTTK